MFIKNSLLFSNFKKYRSHFIVLKSSISTTVQVLCVGVLVFALSLNASGKTRVSTSWSLNSGKTVNSNYVAAGFSVRSIDLNSLNSINYFGSTGASTSGWTNTTALKTENIGLEFTASANRLFRNTEIFGHQNFSVVNLLNRDLSIKQIYHVVPQFHCFSDSTDNTRLKLVMERHTEHLLAEVPENNRGVVELISFQANCTNEKAITISWFTASEHNASHYIIEKSRNGEIWTELSVVAAAGNSSNITQYETMDYSAVEGINYYRLTPFDNDGEKEVFNIAATNFGKKITNQLKTYPDTSENGFYIDFYSLETPKEGKITITDSRGMELYSQDVSIVKGNNVFHVADLNAVPGKCCVKVSNGTKTYTIKQSLR
jgi:hypothetical protein